MSKPRILVIDNQPFIRKSITELLKPLEAEIMEAANGLEGINAAKSGNFNLICTDLNLPEINGIDLCKELKDSPKTQSVPIIIVSALDSEQEINKGFDAGASAFVSKRKANVSLLNTAKKILEKSI